MSAKHSLRKEFLHRLSTLCSDTWKAYEGKWKFFTSWCAERNADPFTADINLILGYLQHLLNLKLSYRTLGVHRSAVSRFRVGINGRPVGEHLLIVKFIKGAFNINPPTKSLIPAWDLDIVLSFV